MEQRFLSIFLISYKLSDWTNQSFIQQLSAGPVSQRKIVGAVGLLMTLDHLEYPS